MGTGPIDVVFVSGTEESENAPVEFVKNTGQFSCIDRRLCVQAGLKIPVFVHKHVGMRLIGTIGVMSNKLDLIGVCESDRLMNLLITLKESSTDWDRKEHLCFVVFPLSGFVGSG